MRHCSSSLIQHTRNTAKRLPLSACAEKVELLQAAYKCTKQQSYRAPTLSVNDKAPATAETRSSSRPSG